MGETKTGPSKAEQQEMMAALRGGVEVWNKYRASKPAGWAPVLDGMDIRGVNLYDPVAQANLRKVSMVGVTADHTTILDRADMTGAIIAHSRLDGVSARGVTLDRSIIYHNNAPGIKLEQATFDDANIQRNNFSGSDSESIRFARTTVVNNDFSHTTVANMHVLHSYLADNNFQSATSETKSDKNPFPEGSEFHQKFEDRYAAGRQTVNLPAEITLTKIVNNDFSHTTLPELNTQASIIKSDNNFSGANLTDSLHNGSEFPGVNFTETELGESYFKGNNLKNVKVTAEQKEMIAHTGGDVVGTDNAMPEARAQTQDTYKIDNYSAKPIPVELKTDAPAPASIETTPATAAPATSVPAPLKP